jgi:hypothetical protein
MNEYLTRPIVAATIPDGGDPIKFGSKCELRHEHQPQPRYLERHHIIPRAWQKFHRPRDEELQIAPAQEPDRDGIWYPETVFLCRTGHGNVHYWIERAMKLYVMLPPGPDHSERAMTAAREGQVHIGRYETEIARDALVLFRDYGGILPKLAQAGLWGGLYGGNDASG